MKKQYKLELRVGDYLLDRGMKVEITLQQHSITSARYSSSGITWKLSAT
jgi:hypothetical protein